MFYSTYLPIFAYIYYRTISRGNMDYKDFVEGYDDITMVNLQKGYDPVVSSITKAQQRKNQIVDSLLEILAEQHMYINCWCKYYKKYSRLDLHSIQERCNKIVQQFQKDYPNFKTCDIDSKQYRYERYLYMISFLAIKILQSIRHIFELDNKWYYEQGKSVFDFEIELMDIIITNTI